MQAIAEVDLQPGASVLVQYQAAAAAPTAAEVAPPPSAPLQSFGVSFWNGRIPGGGPSQKMVPKNGPQKWFPKMVHRNDPQKWFPKIVTTDGPKK